jgi:tol-pal system protein YbgF
VSGRIGQGRTQRRAATSVAALLVAAASLTPGCYTTQLGLLRSGLDSLRVQVDTVTARDEIAYRVIADTRRDLQEQRELLLSTRATSGSTMQELFDHMSRLEGKLDDVMHRFGDWAARASTSASGGSPPAGAVTAPGTTSPGAAPSSMPSVPPATVGTGPASTGVPSPDPTQLYDQATRDLTEGRYPLAQQGYREFLARYPNVELADNAQYGLAECFFAEAAFDSAAIAYGAVGQRWPKGDRTAAALYKLGLCQEKLGRAADARRTFQDLVNRFPGAGEAGLARERLGATHR